MTPRPRRETRRPARLAAPALVSALATLSTASALLTAPAVLGAQEAADREVVSLSFRGAETFSEGELKAAIVTGETGCRSFIFNVVPICPLTDWGFAHDRAFLDESQLPADVLRLRVFYRERGFRSVRVDTAVNRLNGRVRIEFLIEEGEPVLIDSLRIEGLEGILDTARVREDVGLAPGDRFDLVRLDRGKERIRERLMNRGYIDAVALEDTYLPPGEGARVTLRVHPGPRVRIGRILIEGAENIGEPVIRRFLTFRTGEYFDQSELLESQRSLYTLEALRFASISRAGEPSPEDTLVDIRVRVTEAVPRTVRVGSGISTTECVVGESRFVHRNFLGEARRLEVSARVSNLLAEELNRTFPCTDVGRGEVFQRLDYRLRAEFQQPYFFSSRNSFRAALFHERETFPEVFVRSSSGAEIAITRRIRLTMPATLSYRFEYTGFAEESADIFFCVSFGFCQPEDIEVLTERRFLSPLVLSWQYDRTDARFAPTRGWFATLEIERADRFTASDYQYMRVAFEAADYERLGEGLTFAARVRAGVVEPTGGLAFEPDPGRAGEIVHPRKRFFAGGAQSVRGYAQNLLGPRVLALDSATHCAQEAVGPCARRLAAEDPGELEERPVGGNAAYELNLELRHDLGGPWGGVVFVDLGEVWERLSDPRAPAITPGVGLRYRSPLGPLRLDLGYNPNPPERLPVVALVDGEIRELETRVLFDPFTFDDPGRLKEFFRRLQIHISIGEAF